MIGRSTTRTEPAYTVIVVFEDGPVHTYQRFAEVFYTFEGPSSAEKLAEEWARAQDGEPEIIIAGVIAGEVGVGFSDGPKCPNCLRTHGPLNECALGVLAGMVKDRWAGIEGRPEITAEMLDKISADRFCDLLGHVVDWLADELGRAVR